MDRQTDQHGKVLSRVSTTKNVMDIPRLTESRRRIIQFNGWNCFAGAGESYGVYND